MDWFRLYHSMLDSARVGKLSDAAHRTWVELMCFASKVRAGGSTGIHIDDLDWSLRRDASVTVTELFDASLVSKSDAGILMVTDWEKRQPAYLSSTERTREYRKNNRLRGCDSHGDAAEQNVTVQEEIRVEEKRKNNAAARAVTLPPILA